MQFVPAYQVQYMQPAPMVFYPNEMSVSYAHQFGAGTEDILVAGQREAESRGRRRISRQQASILENAFSENAKPNRNVRQELAQVLAISPRNVQIWFQNRRQKAKLLKKTVEQRTREVLEEATKQTEAEQAQRLQGAKDQSSPFITQREDCQIPSTPRTVQNASSSTESTPTQRQCNLSPYSSPQEASYASLARSIAVAAAAAAVASVPSACPPTAGIPTLGHNPFFNSPMMSRSVSTFSDITETPSYPGTPFDYPRAVGPLGETPLPSNDPSNISVAQQFPDFAAAVDANMLKRPATLMHPRQAHLASTDVSHRGGRPTLTRINSCPADFVDAFGSVALTTPILERPQVTLASVAEQQTKKKRPRLSPLGIGMARSKSSMGVCQTATAAYFHGDVPRMGMPQPSPTLGHTARSTPSSPVEASSFVTAPINFKKESPEKNSSSFLTVDMPPTPISPSHVGGVKPNPMNESPTLSLARAAGLTQLKKPQLMLNTEDIFSPPATPAHSINAQRSFSFALTDDGSDVYLGGSYDDQLASSPSQFYIPMGGSGDYASSMSMYPMSYDSSQMMDHEMDFSNYLEM